MESIDEMRSMIIESANSIAYHHEGQTIGEIENNSDKAAEMILKFMEQKGEFAKGLVQAAGHLLFGSYGFNGDIRDRILKMTDKAVQLEPNSENVLEDALFVYKYILSDYQYKRQDIIDIAKKILELNPNNIQAILSLVLNRRNDSDISLVESIKLLERAKRVDSSRADVVLDLGTAYYEAKEYDKALENYKLYIQIEPKPSRLIKKRIDLIVKELQ